MISIAYWLADTYKVHPDEFLTLSPDEILEHANRTTAMRAWLKRLRD